MLSVRRKSLNFTFFSNNALSLQLTLIHNIINIALIKVLRITRDINIPHFCHLLTNFLDWTHSNPIIFDDTQTFSRLLWLAFPTSLIPFHSFSFEKSLRKDDFLNYRHQREILPVLLNALFQVVDFHYLS